MRDRYNIMFPRSGLSVSENPSPWPISWYVVLGTPNAIGEFSMDHSNRIFRFGNLHQATNHHLTFHEILIKNSVSPARPQPSSPFHFLFQFPFQNRIPV